MTDFRPTQGRALPFFANLLPEGHLRSYLAERAGIKPMREYLLLRALGGDLAGAVSIRALGDFSAPEDDETSANDIDKDNALRFSLAGVQLKFSAIMEASGGLTIPAQGMGGDWIVKLPSSRFDGVSENEWSMMTLAAMVGIEVPPIALVDPASVGNLPEGIGRLNGQALAIRRFDRLPGGERTHIEDFAQVFGVYPEDKYQHANYRNIATVIAAESTDDNIAEFIRRLTFNMLIGNADAHLKNWSLIYPDRRRAALAPAYDLVSTVAYAPDTKAALNVSRSKRFEDFTEDEVAHLANGAKVARKFVLDTAYETVAFFHQHWQAEKANLPLSHDAVAAIDTHVATIPLAQANPTGLRRGRRPAR